MGKKQCENGPQRSESGHKRDEFGKQKKITSKQVLKKAFAINFVFAKTVACRQHRVIFINNMCFFAGRYAILLKLLLPLCHTFFTFPTDSQ